MKRVFAGCLLVVCLAACSAAPKTSDGAAFRDNNGDGLPDAKVATPSEFRDTDGDGLPDARVPVKR